MSETLDDMSLTYQLSELHKLYPLRTVGQSTYELGLKLLEGVLYISLQFVDNTDAGAPFVYVAAAVTHPWIDQNQIIQYPQFNNWTSNISILSIVHTIEQEFLKNPPKAIKQTSNANVEVLTSDLSDYLEEMSPAQIQDMNNEEDRKIFIQTLPEIQEIIAERDRMLDENILKAIAVTELKSNTDALDLHLTGEYSTLDAMKASLDTKMSKYEGILNSFSVDSIKSEIERRSNNYHCESQELENMLYSKQLDMDSFIESYMNKRYDYHIINIALGHF